MMSSYCPVLPRLTLYYLETFFHLDVNDALEGGGETLLHVEDLAWRRHSVLPLWLG